MIHKARLERFSSEWQKVVDFTLTVLHNWLKNLRQFFIQSEVKPVAIMTHSHTFSYALRQQHAITLSFDWFTVLSVFLWLAGAITLVLVLRHSIENRSMLVIFLRRLSYKRDNSSTRSTVGTKKCWFILMMDDLLDQVKRIPSMRR